MTTPAPNWAEPQNDDLDYLNSFQISRAELFRLHNHKNSISGFRGERSCFRSPVKHHSRRVGLKLRSGKHQQAFFSHTQHSTAYSCPLAYSRSRSSRQADMSHLVASHKATGGMVLAGSFGMAVREEPVPYPFYDPKESFRKSTEWETVEANQGKISSITDAMKTDGWKNYVNNNPSKPSYETWDLNKRLDAVGKATSYLFTARDLKRLQKRVGVEIIGYVVATEIETNHGWAEDGTPNWFKSTNNIHIHFLLFLKNPSITNKTLRKLQGELHARWKKSVREQGYRSTLAGSYLRPVTNTDADLDRAGRYIAKGTKHGNDVARLGASFWDALRDSEQGDWKATNWWRQFEGSVRGRRMFRISYSLMKKYQVKEERERRMAEWREKNPEPVTVAFFDRTTWFLETSVAPALREELLRVAETKGVAGTRKWLEQQAMSYHLDDGIDAQELPDALVDEALGRVA